MLLDRDGVINENRDDYVTRCEDFRFLPGSLEALAALRGLGLRLTICTNQPAVGRGLLAQQTLDAIHGRMLSRCRRAGAIVDAVLTCPHAPADACVCRKPRPGLLLRAMTLLGARPDHCIAVGDSIADLLAAHAAGVPFILVRTGRGERAMLDPAVRAHPPLRIAANLLEAAGWLERHARGSSVSVA